MCGGWDNGETGVRRSSLPGKTDGTVFVAGAKKIAMTQPCVIAIPQVGQLKSAVRQGETASCLAFLGRTTPWQHHLYRQGSLKTSGKGIVRPPRFFEPGPNKIP